MKIEFKNKSRSLKFKDLKVGDIFSVDDSIIDLGDMPRVFQKVCRVHIHDAVLNRNLDLNAICLNSGNHFFANDDWPVMKLKATLVIE